MKRFIAVLLFVAVGVMAQVIDYPGGGSGSGGGGGGGGGSANALTNNDTRAIQFFDSLYVVSSFTNGADARFEGNITVAADIDQAAGNTASFGAVVARDNLTVTDQLIYLPLNFNGSNGITGTALTNNVDLSSQAAFRPITNRVGTNLTFTISNVIQSSSLIMPFKGIGGYSNRVTYLATAGVNIRWLNWATNGNYDVLVRNGFNYFVSMFADKATNVNAWVTTDDIYVPVLSVYHGATFSGVSNFVGSNIFARLGVTASNVAVGGSAFQDFTAYTNHSGTINPTNIGSYTLPAHALTNAGDQITVRFHGRLVNAITTTNQFQVGYGSQTNIIDTGLQTASNTTYRATITITRISGTSQFVDSRFEWGKVNSGVTGAPFTETNGTIVAVQTNGVATSIFIAHMSRRFFGVTNEAVIVDWRKGAL